MTDLRLFYFIRNEGLELVVITMIREKNAETSADEAHTQTITAGKKTLSLIKQS